MVCLCNKYLNITHNCSNIIYIRVTYLMYGTCDLYHIRLMVHIYIYNLCLLLLLPSVCNILILSKYGLLPSKKEIVNFFVTYSMWVGFSQVFSSWSLGNCCNDMLRSQMIFPFSFTDIRLSFREENVIVPQVVQAILALPETAHVAVRYTSIQLIGGLCEWIEAHPNLLGK